MNPTILLFSSIFTFSVFSSSLLFLITKERFQMMVFLITAAGAFFLNILYFATMLEPEKNLAIAYVWISCTVIATSFRLLTNHFQAFSKGLLILSIFGSLVGTFFF